MVHFELLRPNRSVRTPERYEFAHGKDSVCVYDIHTLDFIKEIPVGVGPDCHATTLSNRYLYIACLDGLYIIDQNTLEVAKKMDLGEVYATNTLPDGDTMLVHDNSGGIFVIKGIEDMNTVRVHRHLSLLEEEVKAAGGRRVQLGGKGHFLADGRYYLCAGWRSGKMFTLDIENNYEWELFMNALPEICGGDDLVMTSDKKKAYIACHRGFDRAHLSVIDLENRSLMKTIPTGNGTCGLTMTADERYVIASNDKDDSISVVDTLTDTVVNTVSAREGFQALGFDDKIRIQGISAAVDDSVFVYECSGVGAIVRFTDILGKGGFTVSCKEGKYTK